MYIPLLSILIYGLMNNLYLSAPFLVYISVISSVQMDRRGLKLGLKATARGMIVGIPFSLLLLYYFLIYAFSKQPYY